VAELHVRRQCQQSQRQKKYRDAPLEPFEHRACPIRIFAFEPAPLDRQPVETDAAVQLNGKQQDQIQRPPATAPHALRRFVGADVAGVHEHLVEMNRSQKEERKAGPRLHPPERCVLMTQHLPVAGETFVLLKVRRKFSHGEQAMEYEHERNQGDDCGDDAGIAFAEDKLSLEHLGYPPHGIVAD
jgi:hypothetical protein